MCDDPLSAKYISYQPQFAFLLSVSYFSIETQSLFVIARCMYDSRHRAYRILAKLTCRNAIDWNEETRVRQFQTFFLSTLQCIACSLVYGGILSHFSCSNFELWMTIWNDHLSPDDTLNKLEFSFGELLDDRPRKKLISVSFSLPLITLLSFTSCPSRLTPHSNSFYFFFLAGKIFYGFVSFSSTTLCGRERAGSTHCMRSFIITARI